MEKWIGATGICINRKGQVLMVLQGKPDEQKLWATPSGGLEQNESIEECCKREVLEETGYEVEVIKQLFIKEGISYGFKVEVHYFEVRIIGGYAKIQDPDQLIYDIAWKSADEILDIELSFPEDRNLLIDLINKKVNKK
ncbi:MULTISPECIES: NUDIX hydrolase [Bacillaceae]|uniref:NUDIX hydrolase n=1 Tax=Bacillaceae TaxID=186817 RepID=UPI000BEDD615|nr:MULTISPECIES: NUDIX hydrolase [unclassified Bacillus (in: firmicutes)]PEC51539.1 DNA mismatch repair protein MutT [Bacillus sp. AFS096315]PFM78665.1 DNA mismatch repair protein MutT [Bacillus sp. AFS077874]